MSPAKVRGENSLTVCTADSPGRGEARTIQPGVPCYAGPNLLWQVLRDPEVGERLRLADWNLLVRQARGAKLLGRLAVDMSRNGLMEKLPEAVRPHLESAHRVAEKQAQVLRWEVRCIERELASCGVPFVLLKGAAYLMIESPAAEGRLVSDVDLMVPKAELAVVEAALIANGWEPIKLDPYDQRYYRTWMHELPPMRHSVRRNVIDLHHTILPESGRLHPDPEKLFDEAVPLDSDAVHVLAPADMVLHSAAHLFQDGDLQGGLRDVVDLDRLLRDFGAKPGFWEDLVPRARQLDLHRPLFHALRWTKRVTGTPIPNRVLADSARVGQPALPVRWLMDRLIRRALTLETPDKRQLRTRVAHFLLYIRSHWLRMPPHLLAAHLARKALRRRSTEAAE